MWERKRYFVKVGTIVMEDFQQVQEMHLVCGRHNFIPMHNVTRGYYKLPETFHNDISSIKNLE